MTYEENITTKSVRHLAILLKIQIKTILTVLLSKTKDGVALDTFAHLREGPHSNAVVGELLQAVQLCALITRHFGLCFDVTYNYSTEFPVSTSSTIRTKTKQDNWQLEYKRSIKRLKPTNTR